MRRAHLLPIFVLVIATGAGCGQPPTKPTPIVVTPTPPVIPPPSILGLVTNIDTGEPIGGAVVTVTRFCHIGPVFERCDTFATPPTTTAGANGAFAVIAQLPDSWTAVMVHVTAAGYEKLERYVMRADAAQAKLAVYPTVTIRPGESVETNLPLGIEVCGWLSVNCRRIAVESPAGGSVEVQVTGSDTPGAGLHPNNNVFEDQNWPTVLVVSKEVWVLGLGRVRLTAR